MKLTEINENIKKGLIAGYNQNLLLLSSNTIFIDEVREYLLTVNVAQQLLEWNKHHTFKINLEYSILHFYNNAFLHSERRNKDIFDQLVFQRKPDHSPTKTKHQKIDIAITQEQPNRNSKLYDRTIVGIELKGINKSEKEILYDANRMCKSMIKTDNISPNSIEFCFCGFLRRLDTNEEMVTKNGSQEKLYEVTKHWDLICNKLGDEYKQLRFSMEIFKIISETLESIRDHHIEKDSDYDNVVNATGMIVGGIMTITRQKD